MKKRKTFLAFAPPSIGEEEISEVVDTLKSGWLTTGPKTKRFEEDFANYLGVGHALGVNSATAGLQIALRALGIGPGDIVITTPMTFCSGVIAIEDMGATPLLVDVESDTLNIDPVKIEEAIKFVKGPKKIKAVIPVHFAGHPCAMDEIMDIASRYDLKVIEDAAHALPAKYKGKWIGSIGDMTAFSFYVTKNMTTAEGGMLTGSSDKEMQRARRLSLHGINKDAWNRYSKEGHWHYEVVENGFKANMTDIQASMGIHQLKKLQSFHKRRKQIAEKYTEAFESSEALQTPAKREEVEHAWHLYVLRLKSGALSISRSQFIEELKARNIGASVHFIPVHLHPYFRNKYNFKEKDFPVAYGEYQNTVSLPIHPQMTDEDILDVIQSVEDIVERHKK